MRDSMKEDKVAVQPKVKLGNIVLLLNKDFLQWWSEWLRTTLGLHAMEPAQLLIFLLHCGDYNRVRPPGWYI